jgi:hypothetical protein
MVHAARERKKHVHALVELVGVEVADWRWRQMCTAVLMLVVVTVATGQVQERITYEWAPAWPRRQQNTQHTHL